MDDKLASYTVIDQENAKNYKVYGQRYVVVVLFGFSSACFMLLFNTFIPIADQITDIYKTNSTVVFLILNAALPIS